MHGATCQNIVPCERAHVLDFWHFMILDKLLSFIAKPTNLHNDTCPTMQSLCLFSMRIPFWYVGWSWLQSVCLRLWFLGIMFFSIFRNLPFIPPIKPHTWGRVSTGWNNKKRIYGLGSWIFWPPRSCCRCGFLAENGRIIGCSLPVYDIFFSFANHVFSTQTGKHICGFLTTQKCAFNMEVRTGKVVQVSITINCFLSINT